MSTPLRARNLGGLLRIGNDRNVMKKTQSYVILQVWQEKQKRRGGKGKGAPTGL